MILHSLSDRKFRIKIQVLNLASTMGEGNDVSAPKLPRET